MDFSQPDRRFSPDRRYLPSVIAGSVLRRISWSAILAGMLIAIAISTLLLLLMHVVERPGGVMGLLLWGALTAVAAFVPAGFLSARAAGMPSRAESALQGLLAWAATVTAALVIGIRPGLTGGPFVEVNVVTLLSCAGVGLVAASLGGWFAAPDDIFQHPRRSPDPLPTERGD
jgi:hypothetical protein